MSFVEVDGLRIAYERSGQGPPLVLVHGFVGDGVGTWRHQLDALSEDFTVVAWDAPGAGGSSDPPEWFRLPEYADCLAGFIAALGLDRPHVAGLSFGGALVLELYRRHRQLPRSLLLLSAYAGWAGSLPPEVVEERLRLTLRLCDGPREELVASLLPTMFSESAAPDRVAAFVATLAEFRATGVRAMAHASAEADLRDVLPTIDVPTLLLYGDADVRAPVSVADGLHAAVPNSTLVLLPGVGHASTIEAPERVGQEMRRFLLQLGP